MPVVDLFFYGKNDATVNIDEESSSLKKAKCIAARTTSSKGSFRGSRIDLMIQK